MFEARHLRVLRAVARSGSFSAAGRELGLTQPAVSQQMKALEAAAGTPLLIRGPRETRLTEAGEVLARHADNVLAGLAAAEEEVAAIAGLRAGRVRLASFPTGSSTLVPTAVAAMRAHHPDTRVSLAEAEPPRSVELLRAGDCDITLAFRYVDLPVPAEEAWTDLVVRCRRHLVEVCERAGFTPRIDFATDDYPAVVGLVAAGVGVAVLPELALASVRTDGVAVLRMAPAVEREVVALTLPDLEHVPAVDVMLGRLARAALRHGTPVPAAAPALRHDTAAPAAAPLAGV
jgi:DNA-binding transcriptional LysR family regulator